jgi:saposin
MEEREHFIVPYKFQEEIKKYVENVCNLLPTTVTQSCKNFIELYGDVVIALLAQSLDPKEVCSEIRACKAAEPTHAVLVGE